MIRQLTFLISIICASPLLNAYAAEDYLLEKAQAGDPYAQAELGMRYTMQKPSDEESAFKWYLKAAEAGVVPAIKIVAIRYRIGKGTTQDEIRAYAWYSLVPDQFQQYDLLAKKFSDNQKIEAKKLAEELQHSVPQREKQNLKAGEAAFCLKWYIAGAQAQFAQCPFSRRPKMDLEKAYFWRGLAIRNGKLDDGVFKKVGMLLTQEKRLQLNASIRDWKPKGEASVEPPLQDNQTVEILSSDRYPPAPDFLEEERMALNKAESGDINAQWDLSRFYSVESDGGLSLQESREYLQRQLAKIDQYLERNADAATKQKLTDALNSLRIPIYGCSSPTLSHSLVGLDSAGFEVKIDEMLKANTPVTTGECL